MARKLQSSLAVEGELPEDGLAAYGDDLMLALAWKIANGDEDEADGGGGIRGSAGRLGRGRGVPGRRRWGMLEAEPETVAVEGTVTSIKPVLRGLHDESPESAQTLFSWAEFLAEGPVRQRNRNRKPQPASLSMFEWALGMEREREAGPVGAGR